MQNHGRRIVSFLLLFVSGSALHAEDWPGFRGPNGDGKSVSEGTPTEWSDSKNLKWRFDLPGKGFSSPIVVGDKVIVTAYKGSMDPVTRFLICVDRKTGKQLWSKSIEGQFDGGGPGFAYHGQASHTPVSDGERLYVMFGSSGVFAFDLDGKQLWQKDVGSEGNGPFGTASSPILHDGLLIVTAGHESQSMRAFNPKTGEEVWKTEAASLSRSYSTPVVAKNADGKEELLISVTNELWSLNPKTGKLNWYAETKVDTAACPGLVIGDNTVYVIGGRSGGRTAVKLGGKDDVTDSNVEWSMSGGSYVPSPVLHEGRLYWINDSGIAICVDAKTGKQVARKRLGGRYYASIVFVKDRFYAVSRFDGTYVLKATPEFEQIAHNKLSDDSDFSASPAVSDNELFIRSDKALYCISAD